MDEKAIRSVPWTLLTYASRKGLALASMVVLARLLVPSDFGVIAIAGAVTFLLNLLQDLGLGNTLILRRDLDARAQGTALTLMVGTGVSLALAGAALAPALATFFDEPRLTGVLMALMSTVAVSGVLGFHQILLQRELEFRKRFVAHAAQAVLYATVAIPLAAIGAGVWSLVTGQIVSVALGTLMMVVYAAPHRVAPAWDRDAATRILVQGRGFLAQGGLYFLQQNTDYIVIGRALEARELGLYYTAYRLGEVPVTGIAEPVAAVTFPAFTGMRARGEDIRSAFVSVLRLVALVACPLGVIFSGASDPLIRVVLDEDWLPMIPVITVLGIWAAVRSLGYTLAWLLNSVGAPGVTVRVSLVLLGPFTLALAAAAAWGGILAVAWVVLAYAVLSAGAIACFAVSRAGVSLSRQWEAVRPIALACPLAWVASRAGASVPIGAPLAELALSIGGGMATYLAACAVLERGLLRQGYGQIRQTLRGLSGGPAAR